MQSVEAVPNDTSDIFDSLILTEQVESLDIILCELKDRVVFHSIFVVFV